jgi:hypothetical protein
VPIESVRPGDEQVLAARGPDRADEPPIDLEPLADCPSVHSIVSSTTLRLRRPLQHITELLVLSRVRVPDAETLGHLPSLERLWVGWAAGGQWLDVRAVSAGLRSLAVCRHNLNIADNLPRFAELTRFSRLEPLSFRDCWPGDSIAPLGALVHLRQLSADARSGWRALRTCTGLHEVSAITARLSNLRAFDSWRDLRGLTLTGAEVRSFAGIEAFTKLERLHAAMIAADDLAPLRGLQQLHDLRLIGLKRVRDLDALSTLPALRRLEVGAAGAEYSDIIHVKSLRPLATAFNLEALVLQGTVIEDGDLTPLFSLPRLRVVELFGDLAVQVAAIERARPDVQVRWHGAQAPPGEQVGVIYLRPPAGAIRNWWIREDLTGLFRVSTNSEAEELLRNALRVDDPSLLARLNFDTEADAVSVDAQLEPDVRKVAEVIERLRREGTRR